MIVYADTSFLVSLYGSDADSAAATAAAQRQPLFLLAPYGETEFLNAIELRVFREEWTRNEARVVHEKFLQHVAAGMLHTETLPPEVWKEALNLSRRYTATVGIRSLELLHVASARILKPDAFCSFAKQQCKLAKALGLRLAPV